MVQLTSISTHLPGHRAGESAAAVHACTTVISERVSTQTRTPRRRSTQSHRRHWSLSVSLGSGAGGLRGRAPTAGSSSRAEIPRTKGMLRNPPAARCMDIGYRVSEVPNARLTLLPLPVSQFS